MVFLGAFCPPVWPLGLVPGLACPASPSLELPSTRGAHAVSVVSEMTRKAHCNEGILELEGPLDVTSFSPPLLWIACACPQRREALYLCSDTVCVRNSPPPRWPFQSVVFLGGSLPFGNSPSWS